MKSNFKMFLSHILIISLSSCINQNASKDSNIDKFIKVHSLKTQDGTLIGDVYVNFLNDTVFTKLNIVNKSDTLYSIKRHILYSKIGKETEVYLDGFYGYKFILKKDDYLVLSYLRNQGKNVSDDITIEWNYDSKIMELQKLP